MKRFLIYFTFITTFLLLPGLSAAEGIVPSVTIVPTVTVTSTPAPTTTTTPAPSITPSTTPQPTNTITPTPSTVPTTTPTTTPVVTPTTIPVSLTPTPTNIATPTPTISIVPPLLNVTPTPSPVAATTHTTPTPTPPLPAVAKIIQEVAGAQAHKPVDPVTTVKDIATTTYNTVIKAPVDFVKHNLPQNVYGQQGLSQTSTNLLLSLAILLVGIGLIFLKPRFMQLILKRTKYVFTMFL